MSYNTSRVRIETLSPHSSRIKSSAALPSGQAGEAVILGKKRTAEKAKDTGHYHSKSSPMITPSQW